MINWRLAGNWVNWVIVLLMFYIASIGVDLLFTPLSKEEA